MNVQSIVLLLAIVSVGGMGITSQAFADHHESYGDGIGIIFQTDSDTYNHNSVILIDGTVNTVKNVDVTIVVSNELAIVSIDQVPVSSDGTWSTTVSTAGESMKYDGEYKIKATYGSNSLIHVEYVNLVGGMITASVAAEEKVKYDLASEVDYRISGGSVESITANVNGNSIVISIQNADDGGELTITLPSDVVTPFNDGQFFVLVNDEESDDASQNGNTVTVPFEADTNTIEIIGTFVIPEFGTIAAIILAVAITSIIVLSAKTKLSIIPKL